jgi:hypothetical protein
MWPTMAMSPGLEISTTGRQAPRRTAEEVGLGVARRAPGRSTTTSLGTRTNLTTKVGEKIASTSSWRKIMRLDNLNNSFSLIEIAQTNTSWHARYVDTKAFDRICTQLHICWWREIHLDQNFALPWIAAWLINQNNAKEK